MDMSFARREVTDLLRRLNNPGILGVLVLGGPGIGKTVLLRQLAAELRQQGRAVVSISLNHADTSLGTRILRELPRSMLAKLTTEGITIRGSSRADSYLRESAALLNIAAEQMERPVLLLDALDESSYPQRMAAAVEELSRTLHGWQVVIASRPIAEIEVRRFAEFDVVQVGPMSEADMLDMLTELAPDLPPDVVRATLTLANGSPLILTVAVRAAQLPSSAESLSAGGLSGLLGMLIGHGVDGPMIGAVDTADGLSDPTITRRILEEVALAGGMDRISALARKVQVSESTVRHVLAGLPTGGALIFDQQTGTVRFFHRVLQEFVVAQFFDPPFRLADLRFGAEEAERDDLLDASFVERHSLSRVLHQQRTLVIGDRGSGKSAIFRKLAESEDVETLPVANTGDLLRSLVDKDALLDADALRAAWLVAITAVVAGAPPDSRSKAQHRDIADLRAALGLPIEPLGRIRRAMRAVRRLLGGATLTLGVGLVNLEAKLPSGVRPSGSILDVEDMLEKIDQMLGNAGRRVMVLLDRIDETFKYDRPRQEAVVQALLQAEARISHLASIDLIVFLRTDLFELYDIQEKNKLVSRSLFLEWSEEDWLRMLIRRVFANESFARLASRLHINEENAEIRIALEILFPDQIEGQPVDRWLVHSLRNGNGDISPRSAVLLLHLAQDYSEHPDARVTTVPLFAADAVQRAMTKLSDLSFSEVVNDFKVASTFVLNCRAGKLTTFTLEDVKHLFEAAEGVSGDQVRLLERLGFLERVVEQRGTETVSLFRIPRLYTRCWDYT